MVPGFPDSHFGFTSLAKRLSSSTASSSSENCLIGVICLPGYEEEEDDGDESNNDGGDANANSNIDSTDNNNRTCAPDGYTFDDWIAVVREAVKKLLSLSLTTSSTLTRKDITLTGIFHDWGVVAGLKYVNQILLEEEEEDTDEGTAVVVDQRIDQLVILDVLPMPHPTANAYNTTAKPSSSLSWRDKFCIGTYQFALAISFLLYQYIPTYIAFIFMWITEFVLRTTNTYPLSIDDYTYLHTINVLPVRCDANAIKRLGYMCYPYRNVVRRYVSDSGRKSIFALATLPPRKANIPILFMYGNNKSVPLHDTNSLQYLIEIGSKVVSVDDAGHWLHQTHEDQCFTEIQHFIF